MWLKQQSWCPYSVYTLWLPAENQGDHRTHNRDFTGAVQASNLQIQCQAHKVTTLYFIVMTLMANLSLITSHFRKIYWFLVLLIKINNNVFQHSPKNSEAICCGLTPASNQRPHSCLLSSLSVGLWTELEGWQLENWCVETKFNRENKSCTCKQTPRSSCFPWVGR